MPDSNNASAANTAEVFDEVAYCYDGSLEGLLSAIFIAYRNHEDPTDVVSADVLQPRLSQRIATIETDMQLADRVRRGLIRKAGRQAYAAVRKASVSSQPHAGTAAYRFVRYAMDEHAGPGRPFNNIAHPNVEPLFKIARSVDQECEHMRQFARFEHLSDDDIDFWFARINPKDAVVPLVMNHFVERFNIQPFVLYDEVHKMGGVYEGKRWYLVHADIDHDPAFTMPDRAHDETKMQQAWKRFYRTVAVDARYNPELRQHFMAKRFWHNLTEMQEDLPSLTLFNHN